MGGENWEHTTLWLDSRGGAGLIPGGLPRLLTQPVGQQGGSRAHTWRAPPAAAPLNLVGGTSAVDFQSSASTTEVNFLDMISSIHWNIVVPPNEGSKLSSLGTSASRRQSNSMRNVMSSATKFPSVPYVSTRRNTTSRRFANRTVYNAESITMLVVRLEGYGDEPVWITTYVAGALNVSSMNCNMYFGWS